MTERYYAVDRFEGSSAVLIDDAGRSITVPSSRFPPKLEEGEVLRVPVKDGTPDWGRAVIDQRETGRRLKEGRDRLEELKRQDPGEDIKL